MTRSRSDATDDHAVVAMRIGGANASNTPWRMYKRYSHEPTIVEATGARYPKRIDARVILPV